jgi:electron transfer flavoprotein alpha subunit
VTSPSPVFVVVETADGRPVDLCYEMLGLARRWADAAGGTVHAGVLGHGLDGVGDELVKRGADRAYVVDAPVFSPYQADAWLPDVFALVGEVKPAAVMIGHTPQGADLAPRLAIRLETTAVTACNRVSFADGKLEVTRPCYGGKAEEVVSFRTDPAVFTVKAKCFEPWPAEDRRHGEVVRVEPVLDPRSIRTEVRAVRRDASEGARLESANIVVAGGGGMKGPQGFELVGRLAGALGGAVGASRVACDLGWCPPSRQVGLSGKTVAPELYVAIGISGAGQHMSGCANAKNIVAINTDPNAPIFRYARYGVLGDCHELLPALIDIVEARRK